MQIEAVKTKKITKTEVAKRLGISRGMLYYQPKRPRLDEEIKHQIEAVLAEHKAYGHKRIALKLKMNKKRILRVMKKFNIKPYRMRPQKPDKKEDEGKAAEKDNVNVYKLLCPIAPNFGNFNQVLTKAGLTLITLARINGHEVVGVLLGSGDRRDEARELLDYSLKKLGV